MSPRVFRHQPLLEIIAFIREQLAQEASVVAIRVPDPDLGDGHYCGEVIHPNGPPLVHRSFRTWVDLAERLRLRLRTPHRVDGGWLDLRFTPLDTRARWDRPSERTRTEKYGLGSHYQRISKLEDPGFVLDMADALERAALPPTPRILDLGCNTGDGLALAASLLPSPWRGHMVGIDHCASAIAAARQRFASQSAQLIEADLARLLQLDLPPFDLVMSIGTLQSPQIDDRALLRHVVQQRLTERGTLILGIPNCSYLDGEVLYGAKMKNFTQPDLCLAIKNIAFYRRYLQQHRRTVHITGKHYLLITAVGRPGVHASSKRSCRALR